MTGLLNRLAFLREIKRILYVSIDDFNFFFLALIDEEEKHVHR